MDMDFRKLSKYLFYAFLFLFPFQTVLLLREPMIGGEKWQYGTIGVYFTDILLLIAILLSVIPSVVEGSHRKLEIPRFADSLGMTGWSLLLFLLWSGLSVFWASDHVLAGYFFVKLLLAAGAFFLARTLDEPGVKMVVKILLAAAVIQSVLGVGQFVAQSTFSSSLLGMSAHESWQAGTSVLKLDGERWLRAYGSFPHPNMFGGFLAVTFVLGISYLVSGVADKQTAAKNVIPSVAEGSQQKKSKISRLADSLGMTIKKSVLIAGLLVILLGLILTFSRAAWLGAALSVGMIVFFQKSRIIDHKSKIIFGVLGIGMLVFVFVLRDQVFPRFDPDVIVREGSVSERVQSLRDARTIIGEGNVLLGVGAGNFTDEVMRLESDRPVWSVQPAHNVFALVFAELGVVGLFLFTVFLFSVFVIPFGRLWQSRRQMQDAGCRMQDPENDLSCITYRASFILALPALLPSLFLDHFLWSSHFGLFFFFLFAGLVFRKG